MKERCLDIFGCRRKKIGWMRHILTALSILLFIMGAFLIIYEVWVLATSFHVTHFLTGNLIFTYTILGLGLVLFLTGLTGWIASTSEKVCSLKMYLTFLLMAILSQVGGLIALNVLGIEVTELLEKGWHEVNEPTRSLVQTKMNCCGFDGPHEFSDNAILISDSCYEFTRNITAKQLKSNGCGPYLKEWVDNNKVIWCSILAVFGGLQLMCVVLCAHIIHKLKDKKQSSSSSFVEKSVASSHYM